jgi:hypothetical protein
MGWSDVDLTRDQRDRACGVLLGMAAGDALGAPYEFGPPRGPDLEVAMVGGGGFGWEPGEWTDDTSMAVAIAEGRGRRRRSGHRAVTGRRDASALPVVTDGVRRGSADPGCPERREAQRAARRARPGGGHGCSTGPLPAISAR